MKSRFFCRLFDMLLGLSFIAFGTYMTLQASVGVSPWCVLTTGLSRLFNTTYGNVSIALNVVILAIAIWLKERIGLNTIFATLLYGKIVDLYDWLNIIPVPNHLFVSYLLLIIGIFFISIGQWINMRAAFGSGPKDSLWVGVGKRFPKLSVGLINNTMLLVVFLIGWSLGGDAGIGTIVSVVVTGPIMQLVFNRVGFEPRDVRHESIFETIRSLKH